jgi:hypothetical protein
MDICNAKDNMSARIYLSHEELLRLRRELREVIHLRDKALHMESILGQLWRGI